MSVKQSLNDQKVREFMVFLLSKSSVFACCLQTGGMTLDVYADLEKSFADLLQRQGK